MIPTQSAEVGEFPPALREVELQDLLVILVKEQQLAVGNRIGLGP
jgi:hypothetical protein